MGLRCTGELAEGAEKEHHTQTEEHTQQRLTQSAPATRDTRENRENVNFLFLITPKVDVRY